MPATEPTGTKCWQTLWDHVAAMDDPRAAVDRLARIAALPAVTKLPPSTTSVLVVHWIATFSGALRLWPQTVADSLRNARRRRGWSQRATQVVRAVSSAEERRRMRADDNRLGMAASRFWFVLRDSTPFSPVSRPAGLLGISTVSALNSVANTRRPPHLARGVRVGERLLALVGTIRPSRFPSACDTSTNVSRQGLPSRACAEPNDATGLR